MTQPPSRPAATERPASPALRLTFSPVILSALVWPGAGQLAQRRWVAGGLAAVGFTVAAGWFGVRVARVVAAYYRFAFDFNGAQDVHVSPAMLLNPLGLCAAVYLVSLVDTLLAATRQRTSLTSRRARGPS